jgi:hypothetical protein
MNELSFPVMTLERTFLCLSTQPKFGHILDVNTFQRFVSAHGVITEDVFMHFTGIRMKFPKVNTKRCKFSGLQQSQNAQNTSVLGRQLQPFVTATH